MPRQHQYSTSLRGLSRMVSPMAKYLPQAYLALVTGLACLGIAYLALFPILTVLPLFYLPGQIEAAQTLLDWLLISAWLPVALLGGLVTYRMLRLHITLPGGLRIEQKQAPRLFELIDEFQRFFKPPTIHRVLITEKFTIEIEKTPRMGLPIRSTNTLMIGLPLLQSLSPIHLRGLLAGKIGQFSGRHNRLTGWLHYLRSTFRLYLKTYTLNQHPGEQPLRWFLQVYTPLFTALTVFASRMDELKADRYSLDIINDDDVVEMIERTAACKLFLQKDFWPQTVKATQQTTARRPTPHATMAEALRQGVTTANSQHWLEQLFAQETNLDDPQPSLKERLKNLGHEKLQPHPPIDTITARHYLGKNHDKIISMLDKNWQKRTSKNKNDTKQNNAVPIGKQHLQRLQQKARQSLLSATEVWEYATLAEKYQSKNAALVIYKKILEKNPQHTKALFSIGRILLGSDDPAGIGFLEKAMALDHECSISACQLISNYLTEKGQTTKAKTFQNLAIQLRAAV